MRAALAQDAVAAPTLHDLASAAGVSPRTLQRRFTGILGASPRTVVQRLRLDLARQTLRAGAETSVLDAALRHGFAHPGRFAIAYAEAFGEAPSATLRAGRCVQAVSDDPCTPLVLRPLVPATPADAALARRATDDLAIALGRAHGFALLSSEGRASAQPASVLRLEGRAEADGAVLSFVQPSTGAVLGMVREPFRRRAGVGWAERAVGALRAVLAADRAARARAMPRQRADVDSLVARARPAALSQEPGMVGMALDLLGEALHRQPAHPRALALAAWSLALGANHCFTRDAGGDRERSLAQGARALALMPDDPEVLTLVAGALSLNRRLDEAEVLVARSLALDPCQPEALRRLGFIQNFRGDGHRAAAAFRRALTLYPAGDDGTIAMVGLGIAAFIRGDCAGSARALTRALERQPARAWPHRFLTAAAMHAGAGDEARRSLVALRRSFPDLTVSWCAQSIALHPRAQQLVLEGLARAGLPQ
ncbi:helix-turn-helix domain-containing protein [Roseomonas populi]|uniref:Helix-turn-helix domain-containing protein n=1 Tax=Roseomonas populi TaxID=3121582 RepID=A0ABT1XAI1_9PROT|nr:helix-turn-helix domain-containing protein [Roseomonas pecuniae]MCR0985085.1 helix-turn-helix domain-containing protein [Roseomonas pecuniae]